MAVCPECWHCLTVAELIFSSFATSFSDLPSAMAARAFAHVDEWCVLAGTGVAVTMLARGVPVGGELDWLDDGTIAQAMRARRPA